MEYEKEKIVRHFREKLEEHREGPQAHSWRSIDSQRLRFEVLAEVGDLRDKAILDVGCGLGDFYGFLKEKGVEVRYAGYDIVPEMISEARKRHPDGEFLVRDILTEDPAKRYDYVFSSGINNIRTSRNQVVIEHLMKRMFEFCTRGVAVNMLSSCAEVKDESSYYATPEDLLSLGLSLTGKTILRHDYKPNDFTLYLYKK